MDRFIIEGGRKVSGAVKADRAKNSLLPLLSAAVAVGGVCFFDDFPKYSDTDTMLEIITALGGKIRRADGGVYVDTSDINTGVFPAEAFCRIRASVFMLGAVIARTGFAETVLPGGCDIGERPIDIHISALEKLGVKVSSEGRRLYFKCQRLKGAKIDFPFPSVGATENAMIAAAVADGETVLNNAAREPEIKDLARFLNACGGKVVGAGSSTVRIVGAGKLKGIAFSPMRDRIEAGTFAVAAALLGGETEIEGVNAENIFSIINNIGFSACKIYTFNDKIYIKAKGSVKGVGKIVAAPYPAFPTDMQAQMAVLASVSECGGEISDEVFPHRFGYVKELAALGADISVSGNTAFIRGVKALRSGCVTARDLRGGAGLTLACLKAEGRSVLEGVSHIDRGYDGFDGKLRSLGLSVRRESVPDRFVFTRDHEI